MIHIKYFFNHLFFLIFKISFVYLFLAPLGLCCCVRVFSSCGSRGYFLVVVHQLLIAVASLVAGQGLSSCGPWA